MPPANAVLAARLTSVTPLFAQVPVTVDDTALIFYHTIEIPGRGLCRGQWDLRRHLDTYLGRVEYRNQLVLDIGTANGFVAFELERRGAAVVTVDLPIGAAYDLFPGAPAVVHATTASMTAGIRAIRRTFWTAHRALGSSVELIESHVGHLDPRLTGFDVVMLGNVLQHLRHPVDVLLDLATRARVVVVAEADWRGLAAQDRPVLELFTTELAAGRVASWFALSPRLVEDVLRLAGFAIVARDRGAWPFSPTADPAVAKDVPHYLITAVRQ